MRARLLLLVCIAALPATALAHGRERSELARPPGWGRSLRHVRVEAAPPAPAPLRAPPAPRFGAPGWMRAR